MSDPSHVCDLLVESKSCLPKLPPQAKCWDRFVRVYKKAFLPTWAHPLSHTFFRSSSSILAEKRRYIKHANWCIIHPFCTFNIYREVIVFMLWLITFLYKPYVMCFIPINQRMFSYHHTLMVILDGFEWLNTAIYFVSAYYDLKMKVIELRMRYTMWNYATTYFVTDFMLSGPFVIAVITKQMTLEMDDIIYTVLAFSRIFSYLVRTKTLFNYMRHITYRMNVSDQVHYIIGMILTGALIIHWSTCLLIIMRGKRKSTDEFNTKYSRIQFYIDSTSMVICLFLRAGTNMMYSNMTDLDQFLTLTLILLISYGYHIYIMARTLQVMSTRTVSETQYEEMLDQLKYYLRTKKLPADIKKSILNYFDRRYQKEFFHVRKTRFVLSTHLNNEITLIDCKHLLHTCSLFHGLSRYDVGRILSLLSMDLILKNEVITRIGEYAHYIYLISYGTVAIYGKSGEELCHADDGDLLFETDQNQHTEKAVAVEFTEVFRLRRKDYLHCMESVSNFAEKMALIKIERDQIISKIRDQKRFAKETSNIMVQLRRGRILDKLIRRWKEMLSSRDIT